MVTSVRFVMTSLLRDNETIVAFLRRKFMRSLSVRLSTTLPQPEARFDFSRFAGFGSFGTLILLGWLLGNCWQLLLRLLAILATSGFRVLFALPLDTRLGSLAPPPAPLHETDAFEGEGRVPGGTSEWR